MAKEFKELREEKFKGKYFHRSTSAEASRKYCSLLKRGLSEEEAWGQVEEYLKDRILDEPPPNFKPPAKVRILAQSRPFEEWPIRQAAQALQKFVFGSGDKEARKTPPTEDLSLARKVAQFAGVKELTERLA